MKQFFECDFTVKTEVRGLKKAACAVAFMCLLCCLTGCGADNAPGNAADIGMKEDTTESLLQQTEGAETIVQTEAQTKEPWSGCFWRKGTAQARSGYHAVYRPQ